MNTQLARQLFGTDDKLKLILRGGGVRRYHTEPNLTPQSVAEHSWRVAVIAHLLWPDRPNIVFAALYHDVAELLVGDIPAPTKKAMDVRKLKDWEEDYEEYLGVKPYIHDLIPEDQIRLKIADYVELVITSFSQSSIDARRITKNGIKYVKDLIEQIQDKDEVSIIKRTLFDFIGIGISKLIFQRPREQENPFGFDPEIDT